ncbi:hypothetical protein I3760_10G112900 [Carya illinoinensis]|uniref:Uncharacterized protein n=1 Tax=Carya illinoinensis TaxID=32201 RepID=A0A922J2T9_CARIL|nr:hypothetical protein I3760_10G112900 [Carya illinoinensis]KAG6692436.1 hypothetical protein I3842_10G114200 [Carya illinoinensis]
MPASPPPRKRFPVSLSLAVVLVDPIETLLDHTERLFPLKTAKFPSSPILNTLDLSDSGLSLFATHATDRCGTKYHIPTYRANEFLGLKNPSSKFSLSDFTVWQSFMDWPCVI